MSHNTLLTLTSLLIVVTFFTSITPITGKVLHVQPSLLDEAILRVKRQDNQQNQDNLGEFGSKPPDQELEDSNATEDEEFKDGGSSISLPNVLLLLFLVCCILYCVGIGFKIFKIFKGTYVEEEPVFLKYK